MTGKVVNLNKARKDRARTVRRTQAAENSVKFGRTKAERDAERATRDKTAKHVDDHKTDT